MLFPAVLSRDFLLKGWKYVTGEALEWKSFVFCKKHITTAVKHSPYWSIPVNMHCPSILLTKEWVRRKHHKHMNVISVHGYVCACTGTPACENQCFFLSWIAVVWRVNEWQKQRYRGHAGEDRVVWWFISEKKTWTFAVGKWWVLVLQCSSSYNPSFSRTLDDKRTKWLDAPFQESARSKTSQVRARQGTKWDLRLACDGYKKCYTVMASATPSFTSMMIKHFGIQKYPPFINKSLKYCWRRF